VGGEWNGLILDGEEDPCDLLPILFCALKSAVKRADGIRVQREHSPVGNGFEGGVDRSISQERCDIDVVVQSREGVDSA